MKHICSAIILIYVCFSSMVYASDRGSIDLLFDIRDGAQEWEIYSHSIESHFYYSPTYIAYNREAQQQMQMLREIIVERHQQGVYSHAQMHGINTQYVLLVHSMNQYLAALSTIDQGIAEKEAMIQIRKHTTRMRTHYERLKFLVQ